MAVRLFLIACFFCGSLSITYASKKFLAEDPEHHISVKAFRQDILSAMDSMLGCGGQVGPERIASIRSMLVPMWHTLPKIASSDRIDRRSLRYIVHRYFMKTSSVMIRGFEPTRPVNESHWGVADILSQVVPAYVESVLESHHAKSKGFTLADSVHMVVMLEQLVFDYEGSLLEKVYRDQHKPMDRQLSSAALKQVLEQYLVAWMVDASAEEMQALLRERSALKESVPHFDQLMDFLDGRVKALRFSRQTKAATNRGQSIWDMKYTFEDAHEIVGGITQSFQSYWQSECENMKASLVKLDLKGTGRVPLSKFYGTAIDTDWRFGESEAYLRELGALDESSSWAGPQVIIPNYIQATSNCIVSTPHYHVCCMSECENLLGEIEVAVEAPTAPLSVLLPLVGNMTSQTTIDDDEPPTITGPLTEQLEQIAKTHGGKIPLHGRLFAQWLHYVFPRECPFPHKIGMVSAITPGQYGLEESLASTEDMKKHAANTTAANLPSMADELQWMSQWSPEEEFIVDYSTEFAMSWQKRAMLLIAGAFLFVFGVSGGVIGCGTKTRGVRANFLV
jgi:hypothetical protein